MFVSFVFPNLFKCVSFKQRFTNNFSNFITDNLSQPQKSVFQIAFSLFVSYAVLMRSKRAKTAVYGGEHSDSLLFTVAFRDNVNKA